MGLGVSNLFTGFVRLNVKTFSRLFRLSHIHFGNDSGFKYGFIRYQFENDFCRISKKKDKQSVIDLADNFSFPRNRIELDHPGDLSISLPGGQEIN
jgi:hypothetical protein